MGCGEALLRELRAWLASEAADNDLWFWDEHVSIKSRAGGVGAVEIRFRGARRALADAPFTLIATGRVTKIGDGGWGPANGRGARKVAVHSAAALARALAGII